MSDHVHNRHGANFGCTICWDQGVKRVPLPRFEPLEPDYLTTAPQIYSAALLRAERDSAYRVINALVRLYHGGAALLPDGAVEAEQPVVSVERRKAVDGFTITVQEHPMSELRDQIRAIGDPLIAAGKDYLEVRAEIYNQLGIGIGGGGGGTFNAAAPPTPRCGYCGQNGNGGHGGFCPNGSNW